MQNLVEHTRRDPSLQPTYRLISGWQEGGALERLPLPSALRGRLRALRQAAAYSRLPRPDVIWTAGGRELAPFALAQTKGTRRPVVLDLDWTFAQQEELAPIYFSRRAKQGWRYAVGQKMEQVIWRQTTLFSAWSNWAAESLRRGGIEPSRIVVNPPGVDLRRFRPQQRHDTGAGPLRLLFIGGDFVRKGGDLMLNLMRTRLRDRCVLDIVTRDKVSSSANVRVHRADPNSDTITDLLGQVDLFVMPTRAECFGISTVEAMACGVPTIVGNVGAGPEIVHHGVTGWLIEPRESSLAEAVEFALDHRERLPAMGLQARAVAEEHFDGERNDARVVETLRSARELFHSQAATSSSSEKARRPS